MNYKTVSGDASFILIEKKSKFIGYIFKIHNEEQAQAYLSQIRTKHYDATHNCYAYSLRENNIQRFSDDNEPSGTAGIPILEVIKKEALYNVLIVVTRYFGGTLLGAGGLVRAYTAAAAGAVQEAGVVQMTLCDCLALSCDYTLWGKIERLIREFCVDQPQIDYGEQVHISFYIDELCTRQFGEKLTDLTGGQISVRVTGKDWKNVCKAE